MTPVLPPVKLDAPTTAPIKLSSAIGKPLNQAALIEVPSTNTGTATGLLPTGVTVTAEANAKLMSGVIER